MRPLLSAFLLAAVSMTVAAQSANSPAARPTPPAPAASSLLDLPVHKVVLYKNGVGYFEHSGTVTGNQRVAIEFTSSQLNDVLQSLTVLDQGGGRIAGVNYNSTTPLAEQLKSLSIGLNEETTFSDFMTAIRGALVEVRSGASTFTGRVMDIESHQTGSGKDDSETVEKQFLTVVSDTGEVRVFEVTPALNVRLLDQNLHADVNRYLALLSSTHSTGLRHLTLDAQGVGQRELLVSYISEVPVWKSTYRMVFPREANGKAIVQGWAVVDNTVGADWDNVQLSLVAGAPQSFIQPLSQPLYARRPEIPIAMAAQTTPQTHEATETVTVQSEMMNDQLIAPTRAPHNIQMLAEKEAPPPPPSFDAAGMEGSGGGVYRASDAIQQGDVATSAFDDYFEYALAKPVTIHKNESAMVPILQQELPAEHVTLWSEKDPAPLRAVWLENTSKLTLDAGSFSIFENGEFAGEGLLDPIHPGEKRLLSYAADQAVKVRHGGFADTRVLHHVAIHKGVLVETTSELSESIYSVTNTADEPRTVIVEHPRNPNAELDSDPKPAETTATAYRFRVTVDPHQSVDLRVGERTQLSEKIEINPSQLHDEYLVNIGNFSPALEEKLKPLIDAEAVLTGLNGKIQEVVQKQKTLSEDEARDRENLNALKGNETARRFVDELNQAEDTIAAARKDQQDLEKQRDAAQAQLEAIIAQLSFDTDLDVTTQSAQ